MIYRIWSDYSVSHFEPSGIIDDKCTMYNVGYTLNGVDYIEHQCRDIEEAIEKRDSLNSTLRKNQLSIQFREKLRNI